MDRNPIWVLFIVILLLFSVAHSEEEEVKKALVGFVEKLAAGNGNAQRYVSWELKFLLKLDVSDSNFSGELPPMNHITGLISSLAQNSMFSGEIPSFDFSNLEEFNVSNNNLHGPIPDVMGSSLQTAFLVILIYAEHNLEMPALLLPH
ncbi:hypothetical protein L6164_011081 [Bauhinia variegata]|uniref:Uncharacterized protein n=1 Tax=Bauhinia variegata TaxID=167791 RepID=A0ACB9P6Y4_BAUVA|nr:hypothetical protein L6164_011081 [Bauhinia variegata]